MSTAWLRPCRRSSLRLSSGYLSAGGRVNKRLLLDVVPQPSHRPSVATIYSQAHQQNQQQWPEYSQSSTRQCGGSWWSSAAAAAAVGVAGTAWISQQFHHPYLQGVVRCEQQQPSQEISTPEKEDVGDGCEQQQQVDPYAIGLDDPLYEIPETDEETDCQLCITFRQGPCRVHWKRFELCVKSNDPKQQHDSDDGEQSKAETSPSSTAATASAEKDTKTSDPTAESNDEDGENSQKGDPEKCFKYAMPFYQCSMKHMNAYSVIGNDVTLKRVIQPLHDVYTATGERQMCWAENPIMIWDKWEAFVAKLYELGGKIPSKYHSDKTGFTSIADAVVASLQSDNENKQYVMMDDQGEPLLVPIYAMVPKQLNDLNLFMTYALDQHGNLLGDKRYVDEEEQNKPKTQQEEEGEEREAEEPSPTLPLMIQLVPGHTDHVTVYAVYLPHGEEDVLKGNLFESRPYLVKKITKQATKQVQKLVDEKKIAIT